MLFELPHEIGDFPTKCWLAPCNGVRMAEPANEGQAICNWALALVGGLRKETNEAGWQQSNRSFCAGTARWRFRGSGPGTSPRHFLFEIGEEEDRNRKAGLAV